jgi:tetratricopeptide (TPR) repeat protein
VDLDLALKYFETALQKDPDYAAAYTGIASVWAARNQMGYVPPSEATPQVKAAARKAVELDPALALAHYALGMAAWNEWDWETNERELRRAIELEPNLADARAFYSHLLIALKRPEEALAQIERAIQLDPFNAFIQALYGVDLYFVRRFDEAIVQLQNALRTSPGLPFAHCGLMFAFNVKRSAEQAVGAAEGCIGHYGREVKDALARGYSEAGHPGAMRRAADVLATGVGGTYVAPIDVFIAYLHAGQRDLALQWLSRSVDTRDPNVYGAIRDPFAVDRLGDDPRFRELVRTTKLPI